MGLGSTARRACSSRFILSIFAVRRSTDSENFANRLRRFPSSGASGSVSSGRISGCTIRGHLLAAEHRSGDTAVRHEVHGNIDEDHAEKDAKHGTQLAHPTILLVGALAVLVGTHPISPLTISPPTMLAE